jgi:hypothetical protein
MATAQDEGSPDGWPEPWRPLPEPAPVPLAEPGSRLYVARDPGSGQALAEPEPLFSCPCPMRGVRCGDCMMIAFAPPPFRATPLGWALATGRRLGWRIRQLIVER